MRRKILLIDDSPRIHQLVLAALAEELVVIGSAFDGEAGIKLAVASNPDLILLDVEMPGIDGFEVFKRLNADLRLKGVPVVFLTALSASQQKVQGLDIGGADYITKPFDPDEFAARIRATLRSKAKVDSIRSERVNEFIRDSVSQRRARPLNS